MNKYGFRITWSEEDKGYIATSPEFPGLAAFGESEEEALAEAKVARQMFIDDMRERGEQLPAHQAAHEYSGQTRLRLSKTVHRLVAETAASEGVSLNQFILDAINERIGAHKAGSRLIAEMKKALAENAQPRRVDRASMIVWQKDREGTPFKPTVKAFTEASAETKGYVRTDVRKGN